VLTQGLVDSIAGSLVFVGAIIGMLVLDPVLLGITVLVIAVAIVLVSGLAGRIRIASKEQQTKVGDLAAAVERSIGAIRTVRAANATQREVDAINEEARGAWGAGIRVARVSALVVPVSGVALQVALLAVIGVGGFRVASGAITIASLAAFILFLFMMIMPLGQAFGAVTSVNQALGALGRIQEIIDMPSENDGDSVASNGETAFSSDPAAISFNFVEFGYDDENPLLNGVSFSVPRGSRTALVGPSGAGKSTILALIERFYDPTAGTVSIGGIDARSLDREQLRSQIGYVEQDASVLAGSIRSNLLLAAPDATDDECIAVLRTVNLGDVLDRSDKGLDAQVGDDGVMLSGGERQRLAIARTLLAAPPILLLDESTSSLDGLNEQLLREAIDAVAEERTLIVIAHRLSTVVDSDQIVVLDHGAVIGTGTHSELVKSTPLYKDLAKHQLLV
jgi:ABC-type multidrug transport system fused ATPase/permease subunit